MFTDWFLAKHLDVSLTEEENTLTQSVFKFLRDNALAQPQVWVHRDYHSRNLMCYAQDNPGIIDFQEADTQVSGKLGQWISIGGTTDISSNKQIWLNVERIP